MPDTDAAPAATIASPPERTPRPARPTYVVGVGASAGGLEALEAFFQGMPATTGMAFVVVQHLSPDYKSLMVELLSKHTRMPVRRADEEVVVEPDTVYLIPPKKNLEIEHGHLKLTDKGGHVGVNLPIDIFFRSLAEDQAEHGIGVILSGTGTDGMRGVRALKEAGGLIVAQEPGSARFDGMPRAAISTGLVDYVLPPEKMAEQLVRFSTQLGPWTAGVAEPLLKTKEDGLAAVLDAVRKQTGVDFTHYKPGTVLRRLERRMHICQSATLDDYVKLIRESPREVTTLFKELLIGVTKFFRDGDAFDELTSGVVAKIVQGASRAEPIRVWVAGCSTGEEAYSLAMLFHEQIEAQGRSLEVKVFATDLDREAIETASAGIFPESIGADVSPERLARFFVRRGDAYHVSRALRQSVVFATHNLVKDAPFSRIDLVSCRNLLIYFDAQLQRRALSLLHFALKPAGYLFLGGSESANDLPDQFRLLEPKHKIFQRVGGARVPLLDVQAEIVPRPRTIDRVEETTAVDDLSNARARALQDLVEEFAPATLLVTESCQLVHVFGDAPQYLQVPRGTATLDVLQMVPKTLASVLSLGAQKAIRDQSPSSFRGIPVETAQGTILVGVRIKPLAERGLRARYALIQFERSTVRSPLVDDGSIDVGAVDASRLGELETELQFTRENLQATIEELETSNEELQATNEELLASNEELQSTNEELQSVNEELITVNGEYQAKIGELTEVNADIDNLLRSSSISTLFVDEQLHVRRFTPDVAAVVNLMPRDVGRPIDHISLLAQSSDFVERLRRVVETHQSSEMTTTANDGKHYLVRMLPYVNARGAAAGAIVSFVDVTRVRESEARLQEIIDSLPAHVAVLDPVGTIITVNAAWRRFAAENGATDEDERRLGAGASYLAACEGHLANDDDAAATAAALRAVLDGRLEHYTLEYPCHSRAQQRWFVMSASRLPSARGAVIAHFDVTARKLAELALEADRAHRGR